MPRSVDNIIDCARSGIPRIGAIAAALSLGAGPAESQRVAAEVPYVPTPPAVVIAMLETAAVGPQDVVYDLGSGDGRIVIAAASEFGARGLGVEIDPELVEVARGNARDAGVADRVEFVEQDLFQLNLGDASVVTLYLLPIVNYRLQPKLLAELKPGSRIVSHAFDMADWLPDREFQVDDRWIFYWVVPARVEGDWRWSVEGVGEFTASLLQRFQRVTGSIVAGDEVTDLAEAELTGTSFSFTTSVAGDGGEVHLRYSGVVEGNLISGTVEVRSGADHRSQPWTAMRTHGEGEETSGR